MQPLRGTKDLLPKDMIIWQHIYRTASRILNLSSYHEIRTPILESTSLFKRSIGNGTDIVNKEMYNFIDQGKREITLRPEGTASIARAFISNKLYLESSMQRLWYCGPMFRYERPQQGRQRQFHQLGLECIGSTNPMADAEVIRLACRILKELKCQDYHLEINSIGNIKERNIYKNTLVEYLLKYKNDLDKDSQDKLYTNPLKILDTKNKHTQNLLQKAPLLKDYLEYESQQHFDTLCEYLDQINIAYSINNQLVRGLDYYNNTAFEIKTDELGSQDTICGGGRYDSLIQQLGGPNTPAVGWAIGIERLMILVHQRMQATINTPTIYLATQGIEAKKNIWPIINILEEQGISFELDLNSNNFQKQLKKANKLGVVMCILLGDTEISNQNISIKWMDTGIQKTIHIATLYNTLLKYTKGQLDKAYI